LQFIFSLYQEGVQNMNHSKASVKRLYTRPIKSCGLIEVEELKITQTGVSGDSNYCLYSPEDGKVLTQKDDKVISERLANIKLEMFDENNLVIRAKNHDQIIVIKAAPFNYLSVPTIGVDILGDECFGWEYDEDASTWFSEVLGKKCILLALDKTQKRVISRPRYKGLVKEAGFHDGYPITMLSTGSVNRLNQKLIKQGYKAVSAKNFRPNILLQSKEAHWEDDNDFVVIQTQENKKAFLFYVEKVPRCTVIRRDQDNGLLLPDYQPLKTLKQYRMLPKAHKPQEVGGPYFAAGYSPQAESIGMIIRVGDVVEKYYQID
jgi:uncharacterized protein